MNKEKLYRTVAQVIKLLVEGKYDKLEALDMGERLTTSDLQKSVDNYGRCLVIPPSEAFEQMNVIEIMESTPVRWYVGVALWTEEGQSDLTLELTLIDSSDNCYLVEVDDLHVL